MEFAKDEDSRERAGIDGCVAFALTAFATGVFVIVVLDRIGLPERLVALLGPVLALAGLVSIGVLQRSMRVSRYYAGGRAVPPPYLGLALAAFASGLCSALLPALPAGISSATLLIGFGCGLALAMLVSGPFARKTGAFSLPDLLGARFPSVSVRVAVVGLVSLISALIALCGMEGAVHALATHLEIDQGAAAITLGCVLAFLLVPGGLAGAVWGAVASAGIALIGLGLPLSMSVLSDSVLPLPWIGDTQSWDQATGRIAQLWSIGASDSRIDWILALAVALGFAGLPPLLAFFATSADAGGARRSGWAAVLWSVLFAGLAVATLALSILAFDQGLLRTSLKRLPDWAYAAGARAEISICGHPVASLDSARTACAQSPGFSGVLRSNDIQPTGEYLITGLAAMRGLGTAFSGLASAAVSVIGLVVAAAGFQTLAIAIGNGALYKLSPPGRMTSRRLAITRAILIASMAGATLLLRSFTIDPRFAIAAALGISASFIAPILVLSFWPLARAVDAMLAITAGLATLILSIATNSGQLEPAVLARSVVLSAAVVLLSGCVSSLFGSRGEQGAAFVNRVLFGDAEVLDPDKGA